MPKYYVVYFRPTHTEIIGEGHDYAFACMHQDYTPGSEIVEVKKF